MTDDDALARIADALQRLAVVAERVYPPPPDRSTVTPAGEQAFTRPRLKELAQWEHDDRLDLTDLQTQTRDRRR